MSKNKLIVKKKRTIYNPKVACRYLIENIETGEIIVAATLGVRDQDQKPWRTTKGAKPGEEFFKMKSGLKRDGFTYYKFMNSVLVDRSYSDDGKWVFLGKTSDGNPINTSENESNVKKEYKQFKMAAKESTKYTETLTIDDIKDEVINVVYGDNDFLNYILND